MTTSTILTLSEATQLLVHLRGNRSVPFWSMVDQTAGPDKCWPWLGGRDRNGYGRGTFGWTRFATRAAYRDAKGEFDTSLDVCHHCDNPPCCNPAHLFTGTHQENLQDAGRKGRLGKANGEGHGNSKLTWDQVHEIRARYKAGESMRQLGEAFATKQPNIWLIVHERAWPESRCPLHSVSVAA